MTVFVTVACDNNDAGKIQEHINTIDLKTTKAALLKVPTLALVKNEWSPTITGSGIIERSESLILRADLSGKIESVLGDDAVRVMYGEKVVSILAKESGPDIKMLVQQKNNALEAFHKHHQQFLQDELERDTLTNKKDSQRVNNNVNHHTEFQKTRKQLLVLDHKQQEALDRLFANEVVALIEGDIEQRYITEGDDVVMGQKIVRLMPTQAVAFEVDIQGPLSRHYWIGKECIIKVQALHNKKFEGQIVDISITSATPESASQLSQQLQKPQSNKMPAVFSKMIIHAVPNPEFVPGMPVRVQCKGESRGHIITLPASAVLHDADKGEHAFVLKGGKVELRMPVLGAGDIGSGKRDRPVLAGLEEGEILIIGKLHNLKPGMPVDVLKWMNVGVKGDF